MGSSTTLMQRSARPPVSRSRRWLMRGAILLALLVGYRLLIWCAVHVLDEDAIRQELDDWLERVLQADASIRRVDADLNVLGTAGLTVHGIEIKHPNDVEFRGNFITADPVNLSSPVFGLMGRRCTPQINIRNMKARILSRGNDWREWNLFGLGDPLEDEAAPEGFPLGQFDVNKVDVYLRSSQLTIEQIHLDETVTLDLAGRFVYLPHLERLEGWMPAAQLVVRRGDETMQGMLEVARFEAGLKAGPQPIKPERVELVMDELPLRLVNLFAPGVVPVRSKALLSGRLSLRPGIIDVQGRIANIQPSRLAPDGVEIRATRRPDGSWRGVRGRCRLLDLREVSIPLEHTESGWLESLLRVFPAVRIEAEEIRVLDVPVLDASLIFGPSPAHDADFVMRLNGARFGSSDLNAAPQVMPLGIPSIGCRPSGGGVEVLVARSPEEAETTGEAKPVWTAALSLKNLTIPMEGAGGLFLAIGRIPARLSEVEALRRQALGLEAELPASKALSLGALPLSHLDIKHEVYADGRSRVLLAGESPELGVVTGGGSRNTDGSFALALTFRKVPKSLFRLNPGLSDSVRAAVLHQVHSDEGLRIDFKVGSDGEVVSERYLQDIFHRWSQERAQDRSTPVPPRPGN